MKPTLSMLRSDLRVVCNKLLSNYENVMSDLAVTCGDHWCNSKVAWKRFWSKSEATWKWLRSDLEMTWQWLWKLFLSTWRQLGCDIVVTWEWLEMTVKIHRCILLAVKIVLENFFWNMNVSHESVRNFFEHEMSCIKLF